MSDAMSNAELLSPGQDPAEIEAGGQSQLGAMHAENATPQSAEGRNAGGQAGLTRSAAWLEGRRQAGEQTVGGLSTLGSEMGGGGEPNEAEIMSELQKYERNWDNKPEADKDKFFPAWEMVLKARLGSKSAEKWCQDNNLTVELHGEVFRQLAARRRGEKMTPAEKAQGLSGEFLIFREVLPRLLNNRELVDQRTVSAPQQGGQNAAKP